jgi:seryl-tRNA synthetase
MPNIIESDAELIELGHEFDRLAEIRNRDPESSDDSLQSAMNRIIATAAQTLEGLKVKARVVYFCKCGEIDEHDQDTTDMRTAFSIVKDLMRLQGCGPIDAFEYEARRYLM